MKTAVELFCGAGGTSCGFLLTGEFKILAGLDIDEQAIKSFRANHPESQAISADINQLSPSEFSHATGIDTFDVLIGGPSCQGYSTIGKRIADDPRNILYIKYLDYLKFYKPKWFVFENVRGFIHSGRGRFFEAFKESINELGYTLAYGVLNAADYGVPQRRERVIVLGTLLDLEPTLPPPTHQDPRCPVCTKPDKSNRNRSKINSSDCFLCGGKKVVQTQLKPWISVSEAIGGLEKIGETGGTVEFKEYEAAASSDYEKYIRQNSSGYTHHQGRKVSKFAYSLITKIPSGSGIRSIPEHELPERFRVMRKVGSGGLRRDCTTLYGRLGWDLPSYTITCSFRNVSSGAFTHPCENRALTIREAARLQSFPDKFIFKGSDITRQIGNAVPPLLAKSLAQHILRLEAGECDNDKNLVDTIQINMFGAA